MEVNNAALRSFIAISEELHYGRAAERLFLTTSALSQQIMRLERQLGVTLFARSSRAVDLTAEGVQLLPLAREAVNADARIRSWAKRHKDSSLRIGFTHVGPPSLLSRVFAASTSSTGTTLEFRHVHRDEIGEDLRSGELDLAFVWGPFRSDGLESRTIWTEDRVLLLPESNPLAGRNGVSVDEIIDPIIIPRSADADYVRWVLNDPRPDGSRVHRGPEAKDLEEALALIAAGRGVHIVPCSVAQSLNHVSITCVPVVGLDDYPYLMSFRAGTLTNATANFVDTVEQVVLHATSTSVASLPGSVLRSADAPLANS